MHFTTATILAFALGALAQNPSSSPSLPSPPSSAPSTSGPFSMPTSSGPFSMPSSSTTPTQAGDTSVFSVATSDGASVTSKVASGFNDFTSNVGGFFGGGNKATSTIPTTGAAYTSFTKALASISSQEASVLASLDASVSSANTTLASATVSSILSSVEASASAAASSASTSAFTVTGAAAPAMTGMPLAGAGALAAALGFAAML